MTTYEIVESTDPAVGGYHPHGGAVKLWKCKDHEVIISGPAETGKTLGALHKLDALLWKYGGAQGAMIRRTYKSTVSSCVQTYEAVLGSGTPVRTFGGSKPEFYDYPNGSRLWIGGMDNPDKVLSSERDFIYVNQAEELELDHWETLLSRATGRARNAPYAQVLGDCNPSYPAHWIKQREREGKLTLIESRHEDNPTLYDPETGLITEQGRRTMSVLDSLTGTRLQRLRFGRWVQAEGVVYPEWDEAIHHIERFEIPADWRRLRVIDFGLVNPFVCLWIAIDHDGVMYVYRELYMTGRTVSEHATAILRHSDGEAIERTICDHDAEDRMTLAQAGIANVPALKAFNRGQGLVQDRLKSQRLYILKDSLAETDQRLLEARRPIQTADEFGSYVWANHRTKEVPVKENDHGMDALRYAVMYLDGAVPRVVTGSAMSFYHTPGPAPSNGPQLRDTAEIQEILANYE